jgi:hypothetical protein
VGVKGGGGGDWHGVNTALGGGGGPVYVAYTTYKGGDGASATGGGGASGGGGAGGPNGAGNVGANSSGQTGGSGGSGGAGSGGGGGAGGASGNSGSAGSNGTEWGTICHGSGGGGGAAVAGGTGGTGGTGAQGVIVITYFGSGQNTLTRNVKFLGDLAIVGSLSKGSGTFMIDEPIDPANKILYHSFVESPDAKNIYNGTATLDESGEVTIQLPEYFDALNTAPRYQFFPMYQAMPDLYIKDEEHDNHFTIAGGMPGGEISWEITGIRKDPYILKHPIIPEVMKGPGQPVNKGECIYGPLCQ